MNIKMEHLLLGGILLVVLGIVSIPALPGLSMSGLQGQAGTGTTEGTPTYVDDNLGDAATVYFSEYTGDWGEAGAKTEVYGTYTIVDQDGSIMVNDAQANSTSVAVGDTITLYETGATYYADPVTFEVETPTDYVPDIEAYALPTTTEGSVVVYDETGSTALTADDNDNNTVDYAGGSLGAGEVYTYYMKFKQGGADNTFRVGAICTYWCGDEADDYTISSSEAWKEVGIPQKMMTTFNHYDDGNVSTACSYKHCYVPEDSDYIQLDEFDFIKIETVFDADDSTGPSANGDTYIGGAIMDYACSVDGAGEPFCSWYMPDDGTEDPGAVGLDENSESTVDGLYYAWSIEPQ